MQCGPLYLEVNIFLVPCYGKIACQGSSMIGRLILKISA